MAQGAAEVAALRTQLRQIDARDARIRDLELRLTEREGALRVRTEMLADARAKLREMASLAHTGHVTRWCGIGNVSCDLCAAIGRVVACLAVDPTDDESMTKNHVVSK